MTYQIPQEIKDKLLNSRGKLAYDWVNNLEQIVNSVISNWKINELKPFPNISYNFVASGKLPDEKEIVLKIFPVYDQEGKYEVEALKVFDGKEAAKLLDSNIDLGAMLLEKITPGISLRQLDMDDTSKTLISSQVFKKLWKKAPVNNNFPKISDLSITFKKYKEKFGTSGPFPNHLVKKAEQYLNELTSTESDIFFLHGDLHHDNILKSGENNWVVIDPKGVVGDPGYEAGSILENPSPEIFSEENLDEITKNRINIFHKELGLDKERIRKWGFFKAILSALWNIEDKEGDFEGHIRLARVLDKIKF